MTADGRLMAANASGGAAVAGVVNAYRQCSINLRAVARF